MRTTLAESHSVHSGGVDFTLRCASLFPPELATDIWGSGAEYPWKSSQQTILPSPRTGFSLLPPGNHRGTSCGKTCREDRDDEWMGVSLARQPKADGRVLVRLPGGGGAGSAAGRAGTVSMSDFDLLGKLGGMVIKAWL